LTAIPREITVLVAASIHLLSSKFRTESLLALVDWQTLLLFASLFVVGGSFQATGYGEQLIHSMQSLGFDPAKPVNEVFLTSGLCVLINNAPAVVLLIKIVPLSNVTVAYVMAVANSFAGNLIMTASVANLIVIQQARKQGILISFFEFFRLGAPIALVSLGALIAWAAVMGP
jgi:Na+/H+ antiporter NhaD/arsenite permease-like protein